MRARAGALAATALALGTPGAAAGEEGTWQPEPGLVDYVSVTSKVNQRTQQTPASVTVISREQIDLAGYRSIGEALEDVPGLYVRNDLQNRHVSIRGLSGGARNGSRFLKVMIDGRPVGSVQSGVHFLGPEFIPMSAVERIEVMRGPASALYGAGALVGAVNVVTRRPPYEGEVTTETGVATSGVAFGERGGGLDLIELVTTRRVFVLVAGSGLYSDRSGLSAAPTSPREYSDPSRDDLARPISVIGRLEYVVGGGRLSLLAVRQEHDYVAEFHDLNALSHGTRVHVIDTSVHSTFERSFASGVSLLVTGGVARGEPGEGDRFDLSSSTSDVIRDFSYTQVSAAAEVRYDRDGGWFLAGVDAAYDHEELARYIDVEESGVTMPRESPPSRDLGNVAGYAQVLYPVTDLLRLAGGLRYDLHTVYGGAVSARAGIVAPLSPWFTAKLLGGRAYKAPSPEQLYAPAMDALDVRGDPTLRPQYLNGIEAIVDVFPLRHVNLQVGAYYNRYDDALSYVSDGGQLVPKSFDAEAFGGEVVLRAGGSIGSTYVEGMGALTYQRLLTEERIVGGIVDKAIPDNEAVPELIATGRAQARLDGLGLRVHARYRWVAERVPSQSNLRLDGAADPRQPTYHLPAYALLDLAVSTKRIDVGSFDLSFLVKMSNVLDAKYAEPGFNGIDIPGMPRSIWVQVSSRF